MNIYVGNLSREITEEELRREFISFGKVASVTLMNDLDIGSGQGRRCGYIEMPSAQEGETAIDQLQGKAIRGRPMDIIKALPLTRNYAVDPGDEMRTSGFNRKNKNWGSKWGKA
jgi:RNA recognition motif-containing protein